MWYNLYQIYEITMYWVVTLNRDSENLSFFKCQNKPYKKYKKEYLLLKHLYKSDESYLEMRQTLMDFS